MKGIERIPWEVPNQWAFSSRELEEYKSFVLFHSLIIQ